MINLRSKFKNQKVLITGHTGFKGSWLTLWLTHLGADVVGISKDIPTNPSHYKQLNISKKAKGYFFEIQNIMLSSLLFDVAIISLSTVFDFLILLT